MRRNRSKTSGAEADRLREAREQMIPWKKWGPYLSERQWGTVREDYSDNGDAWNYLTRNQTRSRTCRWGEDGLVGISDDHQVLCFALALWNGMDPILFRGDKDKTAQIVPLAMFDSLDPEMLWKCMDARE
jgi:hypothetical protein